MNSYHTRPYNKMHFNYFLRNGMLVSLLWIVFMMLSITNVQAYNGTGNEDRCDQLGTNCVCSEPLNTNNYVKKGNQYSLDPQDTTAKECRGFDGVQGGVVVGNNGGSDPTDFIFADNDSSVLASLPSGNSVNYYIRGAIDNIGSSYAVFMVGHKAGSKFAKRMAFRYYVYHTSDFEYKNSNGCTNSKFGQGPAVGNMSGTTTVKLQYYGSWNNWTYDNGTKVVGDCCWAGPTTKNAYQPLSFYNGKWIRVEGVVTNRAGGTSPNGFTFKLYLKNITDGIPEIKAVDTTIYDPSVGPTNAWLGADDITPTSLVEEFFSNNYREGSCKGYRAVSHYIVAGWDTDNGQRIGSAREVEGVAGETGGNATSLPNPGAGWDPQLGVKVIQ